MGTLAKNVEKKGFYCLTFQAVYSKSPHLYELWTIFVQRSQFTGPDITPWGRLFGTTDIPEMAKRMKEQFDKQPEGTRYFQFNMLSLSAITLADHIVYLDVPIRMTKDYLTRLLSEFKALGGELDGMCVDMEYTLPCSYHLYNDVYRGVGENMWGFKFTDDLDLSEVAVRSRMIYNSIVTDPRYKTRIRPRLEEYGFKFYPNPTDEQTEIWGICPLNTDPEYKMCRVIWDNVVMGLVREAIHESTYEPLLKYFPNARFNDYQRGDFREWMKPLNDLGEIRRGKGRKLGNTSNFNTYCNRINNGFYVMDGEPVYRNVPGYNKAYFGKEPFNMTMWDTNLFKGLYATTDTGFMSGWISGNQWSRGNICTTSNTPFYSETVFHMNMLDMQPLMAYVVEGEEHDHYITTQDIIGDLMAELTRVAGYADRKPIKTPVTWNGNYVLSGMYAGGRNIWRITPNTAVKSLADFKVKDDEPTFSIDGQTIAFPKGQIIPDGEVREAGTCGYWVETPADVMPVITSEADRYKNYPAYEEDFSKYAVGAIINNFTALPEKCWEVTGSVLRMVETDGGKALSLTGTTTAQNVKLPQNVTAGDSFAKQQAWEMTFTLPEGMNAIAWVEFLSCNENGGIKIKDGKVSYDNAGTYEELEGVTLTPGKYSVKREVDFRGAFTSDYAIYDAQGKTVAEVKGVPMTAFELPVTNIGFACRRVNCDVLIHNYKLYPTGVTLDFELYGELFGFKLDDINEIRTEDTVYRLSWMNTTNEQKVAYVYNADNGAIIERIEMAPCQDGVAIGLVEIGAGEAVRFAVKTEK